MLFHPCYFAAIGAAVLPFRANGHGLRQNYPTGSPSSKIVGATKYGLDKLAPIVGDAPLPKPHR
jgi:hypothetical protein